MKKKCKVVMLPTEKASQLCITDVGILGMFKIPQIAKYGKNQHLYLISDEEIKEGDWFYGNTNEGHGIIIQYANHITPSEKAKKVVASTDPELNFSDKGSPLLNYGRYGINGKEGICDLPQIPESFIKAYVEANGIDEVMVEYEEGDFGVIFTLEDGSTEKVMQQVLKLTDNNEVIISMVEEKMYSRDDVENEVIAFAEWLTKKHTLELMTLYEHYKETANL